MSFLFSASARLAVGGHEVNYSTKKWTSILAALLLGLMISGCGSKPKAQAPPPPPPPPKPVTATLSASPASIERGQSSTLTWSTENSDDVTLEGVGKVDASGSKSVSPTQSTNYRLVAKGPGGTQEATARVTVSAAPPPPVTTPTPTEEELFNQNVRDIYFDYDKYDLRPDSQQMLAKAAQTISAHPNWIVKIEGNADERGSTEYNIGLGADRATAAKNALLQAGVKENQIQTVSYGKEKPVCTEANDDCWQKNRRDHFVLQH